MLVAKPVPRKLEDNSAKIPCRPMPDRRQIGDDLPRITS